MAHDLNGNIVRLDYKELLQTVVIAMRYVQIEIEDQTHKLRSALDDLQMEHPASTHTMVEADHAADYLQTAVTHMQQAVYTYTALRAMDARSEVSWRNHPHPAHPHVDGCLCPPCMEAYRQRHE